MPSQNPRGPVMVTVSLSSREARDFLKKLSSDEAFRRRLKRNPQQTLAEENIFVSEGALPDRIELPEPGAVEEFVFSTGKKPIPPRPGPVQATHLIWAIAHAVALQVPFRSR